MTMDHVVYTQVYLRDMGKVRRDERRLRGVLSEDSASSRCARSCPIPDPPIQINAVAVRNLDGQARGLSANYKSDESAAPGILTHDRLFVSGMLGIDPATGKVPDDPAAQVDLALDRMKAVVKAAGLELGHMVFVNPYLTSEIPMRVMNEHYARRFEFGNTPAPRHD